MIAKLLKEGQRMDGRSLHEYRNISIRFPKSDRVGASGTGGVCLVSLGATSVLATVSCSVVEPKASHPSRGLVKLAIDTSMIKGATSRLRTATEEALKLEPLMKDLLRDSLDLDSLCIVAGERVFRIEVAVRAQTDEGNLLDAAMLAAAVALTTFRRPETPSQMEGEAGGKGLVALGVALPALVTLGLLGDGRAVADLSKEEEDGLQGRLAVAASRDGRLCCLWPLGPNTFTEEAAEGRCVRLAARRARGLLALVAEAASVALGDGDGEGLLVESASFLHGTTGAEGGPMVPGQSQEEETATGALPEEMGAQDDMEVDEDEEEDGGQDDWREASQRLM